jgi:lipopolysaccharide export system permease protein
LQLYNRYIFKNILTGFAAFITIFISLIWFSRAIGFVRYITENGVELKQFFYLFILILPWLLLFIIPISLFATILMVYNRLLTSNEITILKNSGLTKAAICRPTVPIIIVSSIICFLISFFIMPYANKELRLSRINFQENYSNLSFNPQTFETLKNLTIYAKNRDEHNRLFGILLHDERSDKYSITITAKNGDIVSENNSAMLYMENGTIQKFNYEDRKSEILNFDNYVFSLTENKKTDKTMRWKAKERYLHELLFPKEETKDSDMTKYTAELNQRFTYPLLPLVFSIIGLSFILRGSFNRRGNFTNILLAIIAATVFLILTFISYNLTEISVKFTPLLYLNFIVFSVGGLKILNDNSRKKK